MKGVLQKMQVFCMFCRLRAVGGRANFLRFRYAAWTTVGEQVCPPWRREGRGACRGYLQAPTSLPAGISHLPEAQTLSRLRGLPAGCGGLQTGGFSILTMCVRRPWLGGSVHGSSGLCGGLKRSGLQRDRDGCCVA